MACSCVSDVNSINSGSGLGIDGTASSLELDHIPLIQRRQLLHTRKPRSSSVDAVVKKEYGDCDFQVTCPAIHTDASGVEKSTVNISSLPQCPMPGDVPASATVKVEDSEVFLSSVDDGRKTSPQLDFPSLKVKKEISDDIVDDLDHIVLKERQRMLLAGKLPVLSNPEFESGSGGFLENIMEHTGEKVKEEVYSSLGKTTVSGDKCAAGSSLSTDCTSPKSTESIISAGLQEHDLIFKSGGTNMQSDSHEERGVIPIKNDGSSSSNFSASVKVKDEPWDNSEFDNVNTNWDAMRPVSISMKHPNVKSEGEVHNKYHDDHMEHMCLIDRLNFLMSAEDSSLNMSTSYPSLKKTRPFASKWISVVSESAEPLCIKRPQKRRKTATDSVQTALDEDAPGLLQVLLNKGVTVDEIKLYGETENDEALDESFCEDSFSELEAVISKLFSQRHSFFKFPAIRAAKASRANYCLACLISLVEQTRYLQFRKWPVEWGWCRDLQSFIFVFERHNRIVLERPEYGYATYFFELVESLPVEWQIKRLVTAMKLTSCSRISLIENKELLVGEDLTEGEAQVLMEYGWTPNTGLGTMLNYCDRVVHDRKNEKDSSEWRSKIGKLLMDGFNGGSIVTTNIPKKVEEYRCSQSSNISSSLMSD